MSKMTFTFSNLAELEKELLAIKKKSETVTKRTISDVTKRAPGWISSQIAQEYDISKTDIIKNQKHPRAASTVTVRGETVAGIEIVYKGPLLVPYAKRFRLSPISRPATSAPYFIKATIKGGKRKTLRGKGEAIFLAGSHGKDSTSIPFQRMPDGKVTPFKTLSVPQMVTNDNVQEKIHDVLNANIEKRFNHHLNQLLK